MSTRIPVVETGGPFAYPEWEGVHCLRLVAGKGLPPRIVPKHLSGLPPSMHGVYGTMLFEGIGADRSVEDGEYYILEGSAHAERLVRSAEELRLIASGDLTPADLLDWIVQLASHNLGELGDGEPLYIRPYMLPASTRGGVNFTLQHWVLLILTWMRRKYLSHSGRGATMWIPLEGDRSRRPGREVGAPHLKGAFNYGPYASRKSMGALIYEAQETLLLSHAGHLAETTGSNLWFVREDGALCTPDEECDVLPGITGRIVWEAAEALGRRVISGKFCMGELLKAKEVFLAGTWAGVTPVDQVRVGQYSPTFVNAPFVGNAPGPVTSQLIEFYDALKVHDLARVRQLVPRFPISEERLYTRIP
ncbi:MAG: aminotransferase class IV [Candidatus Kerfeldbacteria bacterium]|nr:aminotransferase class IV [Candidatus Kerfeldbacteria bacterium]